MQTPGNAGTSVGVPGQNRDNKRTDKYCATWKRSKGLQSAVPTGSSEE